MNALNFIGGVFVEAHDGGTIANIKFNMDDPVSSRSIY